SLTQARDRAIDIRRAARDGGDPLGDKRAEKVAAEKERSIPTFEAAAKQVHREREPSFRNERHKLQWIGQLDKYAFPTIGAMRIDKVTTAEVKDVLLPIWLKIPEIARRVKQRMQVVFEWAKVAGYRTGDNPAEGVQNALPKHNKEAQEH